jgi:hypothetical protein
MKHNMKAGVVGVGSMGKNHARVYSEMNVLQAIADSEEAVARPLAEKFGVDYFPNYKDMLKTDIDAITVATPTNTHFKISMDAIKAGKHVLVEKPICFNIEEAEILVKAAEKEGLVLAVGQIGKIRRRCFDCRQKGEHQARPNPRCGSAHGPGHSRCRCHSIPGSEPGEERLCAWRKTAE